MCLHRVSRVVQSFTITKFTGWLGVQRLMDKVAALGIRDKAQGVDVEGYPDLPMSLNQRIYLRSYLRSYLSWVYSLIRGYLKVWVLFAGKAACT